jgi:hypothetical protein
MKNLFFENLNHLIVRDIWMVKIRSYFHKSIWLVIFVCFSISLSQKHFFESFRWGIILMDFVGFSFKTYKFKNDIISIKYKMWKTITLIGKGCKHCEMLNKVYSSCSAYSY